MKNKETKTAVRQEESTKNGLKRRNFVKLLGGGIFLFFRPWKGFGGSGVSLSQQRRRLTTDYNAFLHITPTGIINCYTGKIEMGQGVITALVQMMADEL
ncbi:MAG TPA: molybdopterin-dependent oxidoreductase, partial [Bacteroidales bacterium]|nr:molybdopterin-dependent oxidoreductase [Bacteroidales bacterium]